MGDSPKSVNIPDRAKMARGIALFLEGAGIDVGNPELLDTPQRVADAWRDELIDGYQLSTQAALGGLMPTESQEPVIALGLKFVSVCPHHLLPFEGVAHLIYQPDGHIVGLGRLAKLVDTYAHRLVLQENLTHNIAQALMQYTKARGAGCVLVGRHGCMAHRGPRQDVARIVTTSWLGTMRTQPELKRVLLANTSI